MPRKPRSSPRKAAATLLLFVASLSLAASAPQVDYVSWYYKPAQTFKRIAEHFGFPEQTGRKLILRSDPEQRQGLYFATHLDGRISEYPVGTRAVLEIILPDSPRARTFTFTLPEPAPNYRVIWFGLTGKDEPADKKPPVAWHLTLQSASGETLAEKQSFLWSTQEAVATKR